MGYYNDVIVSTTAKGYDRYIELAHEGCGPYDLRDVMPPKVEPLAGNGRALIWRFEYWEPGPNYYYQECKFVHDAVLKLNEEGIPAYFIRCGEHFGDVEEYGSYKGLKEWYRPISTFVKDTDDDATPFGARVG